VRTSLRDGKDQYYVLRQSDARVDWQAFGRPVDLDWFPDAPVPAGTPWLQPCFLGLMQGDHNAADVAEAVGREILVGSGAFPCQELMPASRGPPFREEVGAKSDFISDLFIDDAGVISLAHPSVRTPGAARVAAAEAALTRAGIIVHEDKGHDDATDEAVWDAGFYSHIVSDERTRLRGLVDLTWVAAFCRAVAPKVIETLIGYWSHACLFRRPAFSVLQEAYVFARTASTQPVALPPAVRSELLALACLAPLIATNLRAPVSDTVVATDAATGSRGTGARASAVTASVPGQVARRLFAGADFRGHDAQLVDRAALADAPDVPPPTTDARLAAELAEWPWRVRAAYDVVPDHINILELAALVGFVTRRCRSASNFHQRIVAFLDNQAACGAVAKGRSSSRRMNRLLRRLAAHLFAADVYLAPRYLASDVNPADPPSRRWSLRAWQVRKRRAGRVFDSTLGYPGEGPPRRSFSARAAERPDVRLIEGGVRPTTTSTRAVASIGFDTFLAVTGRPSASDLASDLRAFDVAMVAYLQELWRTGAPQSIARTVAQWGRARSLSTFRATACLARDVPCRLELGSSPASSDNRSR